MHNKSLADFLCHPVGEKVMSGSCPTIPLLQLELVASTGNRIFISWQQILIYVIVFMHVLVNLHVIPSLSIAKTWYVHSVQSLFIRQFPEMPEIWYQLGGMYLHPLNEFSVFDQSWCPGNITEL